MSCQDCSISQGELRFAYYRWKNANIKMQGCDLHLREVFDALNQVAKVEALVERVAPSRKKG